MIQLYAGTASKALGQKIADHLGQPLSEIQVRKFSDGELYPKFKGSVKGAHVCLVQSTYPPADHLMELLLTVDAARQAGASYVTAVIPYLGYMRQDHAHHAGGPVGARLHARLLNAAGIDQLITCELHAPHIINFFDFPVHHLVSASTFISYIERLQIFPLTFVAPDAGSIPRVKQYAEYFGALLVRCKKLKTGPNNVTAIKVQGELGDTNAIIIDDIVDTGSTICLATQQLKAQGVRTVRAFCTHAILSGGSYMQLSNVGLEELIISDTIPLQHSIPNTRVCSLSPLIAQTLRQYT